MNFTIVARPILASLALRLASLAPRLASLAPLLASLVLAVPAQASTPAVLVRAASAPMQAAPAMRKLSADVVVAHGTNTGKGIDPKLKDLPQLRQPPFSSYDTYRLIDQGTVGLGAESPGQMGIVGDRQLSVSLEEEVTKDREPKRFRVKAVLTKKGEPNGTTVVALLKAGERFFVAGQKYQGGILVIAIKVR